MTENKTFEQLRMLPPGKITARGWIKEQLMRSKNGMGGHLDELEPDMIAHPYINRKTHDAWGEAIKAGWGAEISGNYWYGLVMLAFTLDDAELKEKARKWVEGAMANQRPDGYLGTYTDTDNFADDYNAWGTGCGLSALMAYYEATERKDVLEAVHRCLLWFCENWAGNKKTRYAGQYLSFIMAWCYRYTGGEKLTRFIDDYVNFLNENDLYLNSQNAMRSPKLIYNSNHAAVTGLLLKVSSAGYMAAGKEEYLEASKNYLAKIRQKVLLPTGGVASNTEFYSPISSNTETEYCTYAFFQNGLIWLGSIDGDPGCFDITERIAFNGAQGARKKDEKCIAYFTSANQIFSTSISDFSGGDAGAYTPCFPTSCCPVTSVWIMPDFLYGMGLTGKDGGLYVSSYGPARINFGSLALESDTLYPFRDTISYKVSATAPVEKAIHFRVPAWCKGAEFRVNGDPALGEKKPGAWFKVSRVWKEGDVIEIRFPMEVTVKRLNDGNSWKHYPLVIEYGPLVFSLPIPEVWEAIPGRPRTSLPEGWSWYDVKPDLIWDNRGDVYEQQGLRKYNISWNVAIDEKLDPGSIKVTEHNSEGYVWEKPLLTLTVPGYKALYSYAPYIRKTNEVYEAPIAVQEELVLNLTPYGCSNLRITCFPRAKV
jgi:hypothetical protein